MRLPARGGRPTPHEEHPRELTDYLAPLRKRWLSVTVLTVAGLLAGFAANLAATPLYTARAELFVSARGTESLSDLVQGSTFTSRIMRSLDTVMLDLTVGAASPQRAADIANAVARSVTTAVEEIELRPLTPVMNSSQAPTSSSKEA